METNTRGSFIHLNCHSEYSFYRSKTRIFDLVRSAAALDLPALALTDIGNMYGALEFYRACRQEGIKPIIGTEALCTGSQWPDRLILLARDLEGYKNLTGLYDGAHQVDPWGASPIVCGALRAKARGIICIVPSIDIDQPDQRNRLAALSGTFDPACLYLGITNTDEGDDRARINKILALSQKLGLPLVALSSGMPGNGYDHDENERILGTADEIATLLSDWPEAIANTLRIGEMIDLDLVLSGPRAPGWSCPEPGRDSAGYLRQVVLESARVRYGEVTAAIRARIEQELAIIRDNAYEDYLLFVLDLINYARDAGIYVGPGYGQAPASIVNYVLGITDVDPLRFGLYFERFFSGTDYKTVREYIRSGFSVDPSATTKRIDSPRLGIRVGPEQREKIIRFLQNKYGRTGLARTAVFGRRASSRSVASVTRYGTTCSLCNSSNSFAVSPDNRLDGIPLTNFAEHELRITQFNSYDVESLGVVCIDISPDSALSAISRIADTLSSAGNRILLSDIPLEDEPTMELFRAGDTKGIVGFGGAYVRSKLKEFDPTCFEDLMILNAMNHLKLDDLVSAVIRAKSLGAGLSPIGEILADTPYRKAVESILAETYGELVYQEQFMAVLHAVYGFTLSQANMIRRAFGRKSASEIKIISAEFRTRAQVRSLDLDVGSRLQLYLLARSLFIFSKSHAAATTKLAWMLGYLKVHYPEEFRLAL
ncbi:MAG: PHP domain-containing protein [Chlorobium sp.]|nr:PHP domain-containing protein [Chlorobium sp.]